MATTNDIVAAIKRRLSRANNTVIEVDIIAELKLAQERLENKAFKPHFLKDVDDLPTPVTTISVDLAVALPGFLMLNEDLGAAVFYDSGVTAAGEERYVRIPRFSDREVLKQRHPGSLTAGGFPQGYTLSGTVMEFRPSPSAMVPVTIRVRWYSRVTPVLAAGNSNAWTSQAPDYLMGETGFVMAEYLRDKDALIFFGDMKIREEKELKKRSVAEEDADQTRSLGD